MDGEGSVTNPFTVKAKNEGRPVTTSLEEDKPILRIIPSSWFMLSVRPAMVSDPI